MCGPQKWPPRNRGHAGPTAKHVAVPCPGAGTTEGSGTAGFSPAPVPPASPAVARSVGSQPCSRLSQHALHTAAAATPCSAHRRGLEDSGVSIPPPALEDKSPKERAREDREVRGRQRGGLARPQPLCLHPSSGAGTRQAASRTKEHPHRLKPCEHLWWFQSDLHHMQDHHEPCSLSKGI